MRLKEKHGYTVIKVENLVKTTDCFKYTANIWIFDCLEQELIYSKTEAQSHLTVKTSLFTH